MTRFSDFDLDVKVVNSAAKVEPKITSVSLCTPGCDTGILMSCTCTNTCMCGHN